MKSNEEILEEIHHAKSHSKSSKKIYKNAVKQYCKYNKLSLMELIKEADEEEEKGIRWKHRKLKKRLIDFRQELILNYKKNTIQSYFNAIRSIYHYFEIEIHDLPALNKKNIKISEPINYVDLPTKEIIKKALKIADNRMKAIILFMSSSGCAKRETLNLTIQDFIDATKDYHNSNNIYEVIEILKDREDVIPMFRLKRQKTNKYYYTFCSPEAVTALISYMLTLEQELKPEDKLFPIHEDYVTILFIQLNNILKLGKKGTYNRFRSHMLRKFHASQLYNAGLSLDEIDALQGRGKDPTHSSYFLEDPEKLRQKYVEHLDAITINMDINNISIKSPEYLELEKLYQEMESELSEIDNMKERILALEKSRPTWNEFIKDD
ncbi:site-specific integrase [uncultured Methanobrevibacter sp.]|uniref:tyrosine-type recombinase/integrase n=1 Tax=uncultured Methanobrevibacter sp. TaxID=253161 RepID=UPI0025DE0AB2|nr:site-specific integrase [uncultured Methanobrevibacter sp.]